MVIFMMGHDGFPFENFNLLMIMHSPPRYTLSVKDKTKAERLAQSLPPALTKTDVKCRRKTA